MALCPSNTMVPGYPEEKNSFPNYAGAPNIDDALAKELEDAGIKAERWEILRKASGEVNTSVIGTLSMWGFHRAWYYWVAKGPGIPPMYADKLHEVFGKVVRVAGHCGCPSPLEWYNGFAVGSYHVDSPVGLKALADAINQVVADAELRKELTNEKAIS